MRAVDAVVLDRMRAVLPPIVTKENQRAHPGVPLDQLVAEPRVHEGRVFADNETKQVTYALPYATYESNIGDPEDDPATRRLTGWHMWDDVFWSIMYVGQSPEQAKWAGERIRNQLRDRRLPVVGHKTRKVKVESSQRVRRDDDAIRPDGSPLYYGIDEYSMGIQLTTVPDLIGATP